MSLLSYVSAFFTIITLLTSVILAGPYFVHAQLSSTNSTTTSQKIGVRITSPKANQTVPIGQLTVNGTSSDTPETNCQVYVDWNDTKPMQNVTGIGQGGPKDYSNWTFTYSQNYHLIKEGTNGLTSKITCSDSSGAGNMTTKYYSINVTGTANPTAFSVPTSSGNFSSSNYTTGFQSVGYHSIVPQYSNASTSNTSNTENTTPQTTTYAAAVNDNPSDHQDNNLDSSSSSSSNQDHSSHDHNSISVSDSGDKGDNKKSSDNKKGHEIIKFHIIKHNNHSLNVKKIKHGSNDFKFKGYSGGDLSTYIHNLVKEKLKKVSQRLLD